MICLILLLWTFWPTALRHVSLSISRPYHMSEQMKQGPCTISRESHEFKSQTFGLIKLTKVWLFQSKWAIRNLPSGYAIQWRHCQIKFPHDFVAVWQIWKLTIQLNLSRPMARLLSRMKFLRHAMMTRAHCLRFISWKGKIRLVHFNG